jgi:hypothetical protein
MAIWLNTVIIVAVLLSGSTGGARERGYYRQEGLDVSRQRRDPA